ncbi:hypothetical protein D3C75_1264040 [compost metagenome]
MLTTIMSRISPGIWLELKTSVTPGVALMSASIGFQVVTAWTLSVLKAAEMSASDVLITFRSFSRRLAVSSARASR